MRWRRGLVTRGNSDLAAETAKVVTTGAVLEPFPGLALSVDFWKIDIDNQIRQLAISTIFTACYQRGIQSFCDLVHRSPALGFAIDFVDSPTLNHGTTSTSGVDTAIDFTHNTPAGNAGSPSRDVPAWHKLDVFTTLTTRRMTLTVDVNNVLDRPPPTIYISLQAIPTPPPTTTWAGFFYTRLTQTF